MSANEIALSVACVKPTAAMSHGKCPVAGEVRMPRGRRHVAGATRGQITCNERHNEEDQGMLALIRALPNLHSTSLLTMENPGTAPPSVKSSRWAANAVKQDLGAVGAFQGFGDCEISHHRRDGDGVPDEAVLCGFDRCAAITLGACATRSLRYRSVGIEDHAIGG